MTTVFHGVETGESEVAVNVNVQLKSICSKSPKIFTDLE